MQLALYKIINRELHFMQFVDVPDDCKDWDSWQRAAGYGPEYTLRRGKIKPVTAADIAALGKPSVPLPSAAAAIMGHLINRKHRRDITGVE